MNEQDNKISLDEFAEKIANENGILKQESKTIVNLVFNSIADSLEQKKEVKLHNFGSFKVKKVPERLGTNPKIQEKLIIPEHNKIRFRPYSHVSNLVNAKYKNLKPSVIDAMLTLTGFTKINPDFTRELEKDEQKKQLWQKAKRRALVVLAIIAVILLALIATFITIPVVIINENNRVVQYVNSINRIFGLNKITDKIRGINQEEMELFYETAKEKLTDKRAIIEEYTIKSGDNIYNIAKKHWNNEYLWPDLYITNKATINDPDLIKINDTIVIYESLGDPSKFSKKQKDDLVYAYLGIYRIYKAFGEDDLQQNRIERGKKRIDDARWSLYTAVRFDHHLLSKYQDAIYPEDSEFVKKQIKIHGFVPKK